MALRFEKRELLVVKKSLETTDVKLTEGDFYIVEDVLGATEEQAIYVIVDLIGSAKYAIPAKYEGLTEHLEKASEADIDGMDS